MNIDSLEDEHYIDLSERLSYLMDEFEENSISGSDTSNSLLPKNIN